MPLILHIAVPVPLYRTFDYLAPVNVAHATLLPGVRVKIPWGKSKEVTGILLKCSQHSTFPLNKLKRAVEILDEKPLFSPALFDLLYFIADYYHHPIGEVFATALPTLLRQGRAAEYRAHTATFEALPEIAPPLTSAQQTAVRAIGENLSHFKPFLLFGVTGSGKTEVYLQVIDAVIAQGKQALILVPEIGLTPQTVTRFQQRFPLPIAILHSGLTDRERHEAWLQALHGDVSIIIGTRSAIFTPLAKPGIIIIDEEHDLSFKQQEGLRYSARDLAIMRARLENIPVILGSATPSLETLHNVDNQRYQLLTLPERAGAAVHPTFRIIDLRKQVLQNGLSRPLLEMMRQHLKMHGQVLVFLNRRGYAPSLICHQCGWVADCQRCDAHMTVHQQPLHLQCHHCGAQRPLDRQCHECGTSALFPLGSGTERLEQVLQSLFHEYPIIRIDRDTTRRKGALEKKLTQIQQGEPAILIGTQMLAKGHHFPNVTLAAIIHIDGGLFSSDFRGPERLAQLVLQVAGRAGRVEKPGEMVLQTYHPDHALIRLLMQQDYAAVARLLLNEREQAALPPCQSLALVRAEALQETLPLEFLQTLKAQLEKHPMSEVSVLGPISAPMPKRAGKYRAHLLLQSVTRKALKRQLIQVIDYLSQSPLGRRVRWSLDMDAQEMG